MGLALPIVIGMGSQNIFNLVDTAMVGRLGNASLAAVGLSSMVIWVVTSLIQGLGPAVQTITARRLGEGQVDHINESIINAIYVVILLGIPYSWLLIKCTPFLFLWLTDDPAVRDIGTEYTVIRLFTVVIIGINFCFRGYFNGRKLSWVYMIILLVMHPINIGLNFVLIFGHLGFPAMGAKGAAIGTAIATSLGCLFYIAMLVLFKGSGSKIHRRIFKKSILAGIFKLALPSCLQTFTMAAGFLLFFRIAAMIGTEALAITNVLINLSLVFILIAMGLGIATLTLVSNALGEGKPEEAKAWVKGTLLLACGGLGLAGAVLALNSEFILGLFLVDPATIEMAKIPLILMGLSQVYDAAGIVLSHAHLGGGAAKTVMVLSIFNQWVLFLPACFIWVTLFDGQLIHIWICMCCYRFLLFLSFFISIRSGKWLTISV